MLTKWWLAVVNTCRQQSIETEKAPSLHESVLEVMCSGECPLTVNWLCGLKANQFEITHSRSIVIPVSYKTLWHPPSSEVTFQVPSQEKGGLVLLCVSTMTCADLQDTPPRHEQGVIEVAVRSPLRLHHPLFQDHTFLGSIPEHGGLLELYHCRRMDRVTGLRLDNKYYVR